MSFGYVVTARCAELRAMGQRHQKAQSVERMRFTVKSDVSVGGQASSSKAAARVSKSHDTADHEYNPDRYREVTPNLAAEY